MKKPTAFYPTLAIFCALAVSLVFSHTSRASSGKPVVTAQSAILMNAVNGEILFAKEADRVMAPASTTKIMTAILGLERGDLGRIVTVSANAAAKDGSSMHLACNQRITLRNLLYGVLLISGNDAATAVAEYIAGSEKAFARLMNAKAASLGMRHTRFQNASGLPAVNHYTTAYDLAVLTRYALRNPDFAWIVRTKTFSIQGKRPEERVQLVNHNKLLWRYPYCTGVKTGYTVRAGGCLVSSAANRGKQLIAVVLHSSAIYDDSQKLFEYGFKRLAPRSTPVPRPVTNRPG